MNNWTSGYVTGIDYTAGFYGDMTPARLSFALLTQNHASPDVEGEFNYCELGCGQGVSSTLMAAAYPKGNFWANDFNPTHIAAARRIATASETGNVKFFDSSFAEFCDEDLPQFDFMALHGVWTWIDAASRRAILELIRRRLKVGGVVYISYNALPGWAPLMPLQRLLVSHAAAGSGPIGARIPRAIAFAERIRNIGPRYFEINKPAGERLDNIKENSLNYLAHEYFVGHFSPAYHADVVQDFSEIKLSYVCSADIRHQVDALNFDTPQLEMLGEIDDPVLQETVKDYMLARRFRMDIFTKGLSPMDEPTAKTHWLNARFALNKSRADAPTTVTGPIGEASLHPEVYGPILDALVAGPTSVARMMSVPAVGALGYDRVRQAITVLVGAEVASPCLAEENDTLRMPGTRAFNAASLERGQRHGTSAWLASNITGSGVAVAGVMQLFLQARLNGRTDLAEFAWESLSARGVRIKKDGNELESAEENLAELHRNAARFDESILPVFRNLGVT